MVRPYYKEKQTNRERKLQKRLLAIFFFLLSFHFVVLLVICLGWQISFISFIDGPNIFSIRNNFFFHSFILIQAPQQVDTRLAYSTVDTIFMKMPTCTRNFLHVLGGVWILNIKHWIQPSTFHNLFGQIFIHTPVMKTEKKWKWQ